MSFGWHGQVLLPVSSHQPHGQEYLPMPPKPESAMRKPDGTIRKELQHFNDSAHAHELTFSCRHRWPLLNKDRSRQWVIEALDLARAKYDLELWAYVIMPEHVHALLYPKRDAYDMAKVL